MKITIYTKVALVLMLASVIPLAIAVTLAYHHRAADARRLADHDVRQCAFDCARQIGQELQSLCDQARRLAADPPVVQLLQECFPSPNHAENENVERAALPPDNQRLEALIQNDASRHLRAGNRSFRTVMVYDLGGKLAAATDRLAAAGPPGWLNMCLAGDTDGPTLIDESDETSGPGLSILTRIRDESGQVLGAARAVIDTGRLLDSCTAILPANAGATFDVVCASAIVVSSDRLRVGLAQDVDAVQDELADGEIVHASVVEPPVPGRALHVVARKPVSTGFAGMRGEVDTLVLLSGASILVFFLIGLYISHQHIVVPIKQLTKGARILASGDLSHRIAPHRGGPAGQSNLAKDELDDLAHEFNRMADALMRSHEGLEEMVGTRTNELAEENRRALEARAELEQVLAKLRETQANLIQTEKLASLGQLVAGVAHEINNPLSFVINNLAVIERDYRSILRMLLEYRKLRAAAPIDHAALSAIAAREDEIDVDYLDASADRIFSSTVNGLNRVKTIVMDLKDFSRPDSHEPEDVDVQQALDTTLELVGFHLLSKGIHVVREYTNPGTVRCYSGRLNQMFVNLIVNAIQATDKGGTITLRTWERNDRVIIQVSDTGCGIAPEHVTRIFDPFFTTKKPGEGTGLGLSVSYGIVHEHDGTIEVQSRPGHGSVFTISLPRTFREATA